MKVSIKFAWLIPFLISAAFCEVLASDLSYPADENVRKYVRGWKKMAAKRTGSIKFPKNFQRSSSELINLVKTLGPLYGGILSSGEDPGREYSYSKMCVAVEALGDLPLDELGSVIELTSRLLVSQEDRARWHDLLKEVSDIPRKLRVRVVGLVLKRLWGGTTSKLIGVASRVIIDGYHIDFTCLDMLREEEGDDHQAKYIDILMSLSLEKRSDAVQNTIKLAKGRELEGRVELLRQVTSLPAESADLIVCAAVRFMTPEMDNLSRSQQLSEVGALLVGLSSDQLFDAVNAIIHQIDRGTSIESKIESLHRILDASRG